jgi:hypothetical protein
MVHGECLPLSLPLLLAVYIAVLAAYAWYVILLQAVLQVLLYSVCRGCINAGKTLKGLCASSLGTRFDIDPRVAMLLNSC